MTSDSCGARVLFVRRYRLSRPDGFLFLCDRSKDLIISCVNIYPAEIEGQLHKMPGVVDCAVFGMGESLSANSAIHFGSMRDVGSRGDLMPADRMMARPDAAYSPAGMRR